MSVICFDLEGPLSPQDNAYEVMGLVENGHKIFEVLSRYDDILALERRKNYEPGDTLSLIIPFLLYHKINEGDVKKVSETAGIVPGARETIAKLREWGWNVNIISTSYQQHAYSIGKHVGVETENIYCTKLPLNEFYSELKDADFSLVEELESDILEKLYPNMSDDNLLKSRLDRFYYDELLKTKLGQVFKRVSVVGGERKVNALKKVAEKTKTKLEGMVAVGDSITDFKMLGLVRDNNGLAIVFNGNEYAVPYANVGLACSDMRPILIVLKEFEKGMKEVGDVVKKLEKNVNAADIAIHEVKKLLMINKNNQNFVQPQFNWLLGVSEEKQEKIIEAHKKARKFVRGAAAKLG